MKKICIIIMAFIFVLFYGSQAYASAPDDHITLITEVTNIFTSEVESNGSTVDEEIDSLLCYYEDIRTEQNAIQVDYLIEGIIDLRRDISLRANPFKRIEYSIAVKACLAYFNLNGFMLSAELLNVAYHNTSEEYIYSPIHSYILYHTKKYKEISDASNIKGIETFDSKETKIETDAYYAIHGFNYTKSNPSSQELLITDTYDYSGKEEYGDGLVNTAVKEMYYAQEAGVIIPFEVEISGETPHSKSYYPDYFNRHSVYCTRCNLKYKESHEFVTKSISNTTHTEECKFCLDERTKNHVLEYKSNTTEEHTFACDCGYESMTPHIYSSAASPIDLNYHSYSCSVCFYKKCEEHHWVVRQKKYSFYALSRFYICDICGLAKDTQS